MGKELDRLQAQHLAIMDLDIAGMSGRDIASQLGIHENTVSGIKNSTLYQHSLSVRRNRLVKSQEAMLLSTVGKAREVLENSAADAALELAKLAKSAENESVRLKANESILDRTGLGGVEESGRVIEIKMKTQDAALLRIVLREDRDDFSEENELENSVELPSAKRITSKEIVGSKPLDENAMPLNQSTGAATPSPSAA